DEALLVLASVARIIEEVAHVHRPLHGGGRRWGGRRRASRRSEGSQEPHRENAAPAPSPRRRRRDDAPAGCGPRRARRLGRGSGAPFTVGAEETLADLVEHGRPAHLAEIVCYGVVSSRTVQVPFAEHSQRHSLTVGTEPVSCLVRNFPTPVGAPTGSMLPLSVGFETPHAAQALASHLCPTGACG